MKRRWPYLLLLVIAGIALAVVVYPSAQGPLITIKNRSAATLSNVAISGSGFSATIGEMLPNESRQLAVYPRGESGVRVVFDAGGKHFEPAAVGYIESQSRYRLRLAVDAEFKLTVTSSFFGYQE